VAGLIVEELKKANITSPKAHANVLATVKAESDFVPKNESLFYSTVEGILGTFGVRAGPKETAQQFVSTKGNNKSEQLANVVYAKTCGKSEPGDAYKYRRRGFIQHTGKNQYKALAKGSGIDVVSNPDALNSPAIAAKVIPWFFLNYKGLKVADMDSMSKVNGAVAFADDTRKKGYIGDKAVKREALAASYESKISSGQSIEQASTDVASGQRKQQKPTTPINVNAPTTNTTTVVKNESVRNPKEKKSDTGQTLFERAA
jgi:putative chitinase